MSAFRVPLEIAACCTPPAVALSVLEAVRLWRGASQWWDVIAVAFAVWFGLLSVTAWCCLLVAWAVS